MTRKALVEFLLLTAEESEAGSDYAFYEEDNHSQSEYDDDDDDDDEPAERVRGTGILGRDVLAAVWHDIDKTSLPSWITRAPARVGSSKVGKLSADQWRITCTIHLPITLIRLWGSLNPDDRQHQLLENFLDLVQVTKLCYSRKTSRATGKQITRLLHRYLVKMRELFPEVSITPYQHLCLHLEYFLQRFGPTHSWRCFAFERANYILQRINTNSKFGLSGLISHGCTTLTHLI
ncbi:hypothetical protein SISSUDRAFT_1027949 [Sistotremastrum suecicum HHB10207 ss-3]|uniref:DUF4218 domain-containing protein n=1 Tax=Sistotremastrum suecicum HHB10207 ss-3 TaxID=1314776 RepID=A0A165YCG8_9AGAM|nr:hypothetical protein SISSUDRAFT_1027949 [Sistotremastrum suecicum HHB10207 ss-3]